MKVYKNKWFNRFCKNQKITDAILLKMVDEIKSGKIDVDYGGSVIKQRLSRSNKGKSGGYRNIILYKSGENVFFVYGYAKNDRDNLTKEEVSTFKDMAKAFFKLTEEELDKATKKSILIEVKER